MDSRSSEERIVAIYRETINQLYGYVARSSGGDRGLAEDVTQETWLRAVREWRRKGPPERPLAWLMTVAHNLLASYHRRRPHLQFDPETQGEPAAASAAGDADSESIQSAVTGALTRIPAEQACLIEAFHFDDRAMSQIAKSAGLSERAVEGRLRRARQRLRRELESFFGRGVTR